MYSSKATNEVLEIVEKVATSSGKASNEVTSPPAQIRPCQN